MSMVNNKNLCQLHGSALLTNRAKVSVWTKFKCSYKI